jgi:monofunctional biosynthetic peptidoglycan transglycosylase
MVYMGRVTAVRKRARLRLGRTFAVLLGALGAKVIWDLATLPSAEPLASGPPPVTALMRQREAEAAEAFAKPRHKQHVVTLQEIAPSAISSVVISEDAGFFVHDGIDTQEIEAAAARAVETGKIRGASTITQQLAKNLFLSGERSWLRKGQEAIITWMLENTMTKRRILELYLNVAEWGDGVFGAEAAARHHFGVSAAALDAGQAAWLAAILPSPRRYARGRTTPYIDGRVAHILTRMEKEGAQIP